VLCVVDQHIRPAAELQQLLVVFGLLLRREQLVVRYEEQCLLSLSDAKTQRVLFVPDRYSVYAGPIDNNGSLKGCFHLSNVGLKFIQPQRKETHAGVPLEGTLQIIGSIREPIQKNTSVGLLHRLEEGESLDMIPVSVGDKKVKLDGFSKRGEVFTEGPNPGARIDNDPGARLKLDFQTGGIASVPEGVRPRHCNGSPGPPECEFHDWLVSGYSLLAADFLSLAFCHPERI
jgi:hypothetical protein